MILETTYTDRETILYINKLVGRPFSFWERLKMGGIGSKRMAISSISKEYEEYLNATHYITYANIELRPKGIIIHFRYKLEAFSWPMPFDQLKISREEDVMMESGGKFISFREGMAVNKKFIQRLLGMLPQ